MISIRAMTVDDLPLVMRLKSIAQWNQLEADIYRYLALEPEGCFVAEYAGEAVGTLTVCIFPEEAWIAMVLVDEKMRGKGIGTALMTHALAFIDRRGMAVTRLDATPMGQPIYEKLGFLPEFTLARYSGVLPPAPPVAGVVPYSGDRLEEVLALERQVLAIDRRKMLVRMLAEHPELGRLILRDGKLTAFLLARPGARAWQIGPCLATVAEDGRLLFADVQHRLAAQTVYLDIPLANEPATAMAEQLGLTVQRNLLRMRRGGTLLTHSPGIWASSGPEKG